MRACAGDYFIYNDKILSTKEFDKSKLYRGKALYEVIGFYNKKFLYLDDHIKRFLRSASLAGLKIWINEDELAEKITSLPVINNINNGSVNVVFNYSDTNTFTAYINASEDSPQPVNFAEGVSTRFYFWERENPNVKIFNRNFREKAGRIIREHHLWEVILVDKNGYITEASRSNVFLIKGELVYTSPVEDILPGITRKHILEICNNLNIKLVEEKIPYTRLGEMDAIFLTGTTSKVLPVKSVNDMEFDTSNHVVRKIMDAFDVEIESQTGK